MVAGIGAGVSAVDNVINAVATSAAKVSNSLSGSVTIDDNDVFEIIPQYSIAPLDDNLSNVKDVTTSPDNQWTSS